MQIVKGIQPNCSELVYQICGVTQEVADKMKELFIAELKDKYTTRYLNDYATGVYATYGKYCKNLYNYDGCGHIPDWDVVVKVAKSMGYEDSWVDSCSQPIVEDEHMEEIINYQREKKSGDI